MTEESAAKNDARRGSLLFEELWEWMGRGMISSGFSGQIIASLLLRPSAAKSRAKSFALMIPGYFLPFFFFFGSPASS